MQASMSRVLETLSVRLVDHVVAINEGLRSEIVCRRGVARGKVTVVPNAVEDAVLALGGRFEPPERVSRYGYVGNLSAIEGLDILVEGFRRAFPNGEDVRLLFHGRGPYEAELRALLEAVDDGRMSLCGPFGRASLEAVYRSVDCVVLPRPRNRLTDTVTPLKPLEAMAFKRLVLISDALGLLEVVGCREHALVFRAGDAGALAACLRNIHAGEVGVTSIARRGYEFVRQERAWNAIAETYARLYESR
jgi:glycosyltransferase involved in cell wall biosynthesis